MQAVVPSPAPPSAPAATAPPATPTAARDDELTTLAIARDEDMATLHSRLERAADRRLLLALASDARVLRRPLDFRILGRLAEGLGLELVIATVDPRRRRLAKEHGFAVRALPRESRWQPRSSVIAGLFATVFMLAVAAMGLPRTSVTLSPGVAPITEETTLTVDLRPGAPGVASGWIGGKTLAVTFDVEQTIPTSGKETIGHEPAKGQVTIHDLRPYTPPPPPAPNPAAALSNLVTPWGTVSLPSSRFDWRSYLPPAAPSGEAAAPPPERVLPAGTALVANTGLRFFTEAEVHLPPSGFASVPVVAEHPGRAGNLPAGAIDRLEDPDVTDVRVENRLPTWGGTDRVLPVVAAEDRAALQQALGERAAAEAPARLFAQAGVDYVLVPDTATWAVEGEYDYAAGQSAPQLWGRALVRAQAVGVPRQALEEVAGRHWQGQLPSGLVGVGTPQLAGAPALREQTDDYLVISLPLQGAVTARLDAGALANQLRGQPVEAIRARLAGLPGLRTPPQVEVWPAWAPAALRVDVAVATAR